MNFESVRVNVLRLCNDLLKRLSRSIDTQFCGRILVFLAKFFPLMEKSGLNIVGQFNTDNVTRYEQPRGATNNNVQQTSNGGSSSGTEPMNDMSIDVDMEEGEMKDMSVYVIYIHKHLFSASQSTMHCIANSGNFNPFSRIHRVVSRRWHGRNYSMYVCV